MNFHWPTRRRAQSQKSPKSGQKRRAKALRFESLERRMLLAAQVLQGPSDSIDTYVTNAQLTTANLGGLESLEFYSADLTPGSESTQRALIEFDLSGVGSVGSATLEIYQIGHDAFGGTPSALSIDVYAVTKDWDEGTGTNPWAQATDGASWQNAKNSDPWQNAGVDWDTTTDFGNGPNGLIASATVDDFNDGSWMSFDVTEVASAWKSGTLANHGLILVPSSGLHTQYSFAASEYSTNTNLAPKLTVDESVVIPEVTVTGSSFTESAGNAVVNVTLSASPTSDVTMQYSTADQDAIAGADYSTASGSLTFLAGTTNLTQSITVPIVDDSIDESDESFTVTISNLQNATISNPTATVTILDDDTSSNGPAVLQGTSDSIDTYVTSAQLTDANLGGLETLEFYSANLTPGSESTQRSLIEFDLSTVGSVGSAILEIYQVGHDAFGGTPSALSIDVYAVTKDWDEGTGNNPWASATEGASWQNAKNSDPWQSAGVDWDTSTDFGNGPNGLIASATVDDSNDGSWMSFDVTEVASAWKSGTLANHGLILVPSSGLHTQYTFAASEYSANATLAPKLTVSEGVVIPDISISNTFINESAGTATVSVTLSDSPSSQVTVQYGTSDQSASAGSDYSEASGVLTFPANTSALTQSISIPIVNDLVDETDETFSVALSNAVNANISSGTATVTIIDDDTSSGGPIVLQGTNDSIDTYVTSAQLTDANLGGLETLEFYSANLTPGSESTQRSLIEFDLSSVGSVGSAVLEIYQVGHDAFGGTPSALSIDVYAVTKDWDEGTGTNPWASATEGASWQNAKNSDPWQSAGVDWDTSTNFGNGPNGLIASATVDDSNDGSWMSFDVTEVASAWKSGTLANHGLILVPSSGLHTQYTFRSSEYSADPTLAPKLTIQEGGSSSTPSISVSSVSVNESDGTAAVNVSLSASPSQGVMVSFATSDQSANAISDYQSTSGTLMFSPDTNQLSQQVIIPIINDSIEETTETFLVSLSEPVNATLGSSSGTVTILDDDQTTSSPGLRVLDNVVSEVDAGSTTVTVTVELVNVPGGGVTVDYETFPYTATESVDFLHTSGSLSFAAGQQSRQFNVTIPGDTKFESNEKFRVQLRNASGAPVLDGAGYVTILDNDPNSQSTDPFFEPSDFVDGHLGGFILPNPTGYSFSFLGGQGLELRTKPDDTKSLYMTGFIDGSQTETANRNPVIAEVSIPSQLESDVNAMSTAGVLSSVNLENMLEVNWLDQTGPVPFEANSNTGIAIEDMLIENDRLIVSATQNYAVGGGFSNSHFVIDTLDLNSVGDANVAGLYNIGDGLTGQNLGFDGTHAGYLGGYMASIPGPWQPAFGGTHVLGANGANGVNNTSQGPSAFAFNAAEVDSSSPTAPNVLGYYPYDGIQYDHSLGYTDPGSGTQGAPSPVVMDEPLFNANANVADIVFAPETRSVLFIGNNGLDEDTGEAFTWYGEVDQADPVYFDTARTDAGYHSLHGKYEYMVWAYDIYDYLDVMAGTVDPWEIRPHDAWTFDFPGQSDLNPDKGIGGTAFDPDSNLLYVAQERGGQAPIVHVFQLGNPSNAEVAGGAASTPSSAPNVTAAQASTILDAAIDIWDATGITANQLSVMESMSIIVADLGGSYLANVSGDTIVIDLDAAGHGWFIDDSPFADEEYWLDDGELVANQGGPAEDHVDLLSIVLHELGHAIELEHSFDGLMQPLIPTGHRYKP